MDIFLIKDGVIENCICADSTERALEFYPDHICIERTEKNSMYGPNDLYIDGVFSSAPPKPVVLLPITRLDFLRRFTPEQRIAIRTAADPVIVDAMELLNLAETIELDDSDTVFFVNYLANQKYITTEDVNRILGVV